MTDEELQRFVVTAHHPVWARDEAEAAARVQRHTSRKLGLLRPVIEKVESVEGTPFETRWPTRRNKRREDT